MTPKHLDYLCEPVKAMQPDAAKVTNMEKYFLRPTPIGCALRLYR